MGEGGGDVHIIGHFQVSYETASSTVRIHGVQRRMVLVDIFFEFFKFVVDICDLVHDVEAINGLC